MTTIRKVPGDLSLPTINTEINGSKVFPDFGSKNIETDGYTKANYLIVGNAPTIISGTGVPTSTPSNGSLYIRIDGTSSTALYSYHGSWTVIGGGAPTGSAGGDLTGTYPNPTVASLTGTAGSTNVLSNELTWSNSLTPLLHQSDTINITSNNFTVRAQNSTHISGTGGDLLLSSGSAITNGKVRLQIAGVNAASFDTTSISFFDSSNTNSLAVFNNTTNTFYSSNNPIVEIGSSYLSISNATALPTTGILRIPNDANITGIDNSGTIDIRLMRVSPTNSVDIGILHPSVDGYVNLQVQGVDVASIITDKFITNRGRRSHITFLGTGDLSYNVQQNDHIFSIDTTSNTVTLFLPTSIIIGDMFIFKDTGGVASINNIIIDGNGNNIDGSSTFTINVDRGSIEIIFTGTEWSIL